VARDESRPCLGLFDICWPYAGAHMLCLLGAMQSFNHSISHARPPCKQPWRLAWRLASLRTLLPASPTTPAAPTTSYSIYTRAQTTSSHTPIKPLGTQPTSSHPPRNYIFTRTQTTSSHAPKQPLHTHPNNLFTRAQTTSSHAPKQHFHTETTSSHARNILHNLVTIFSHSLQPLGTRENNFN
jgi:hypothetical protein